MSIMLLVEECQRHNFVPLIAGQCDSCTWLAPIMSRAPVPLLQVTICSNLEALQVLQDWLLAQICHNAVWGKSSEGSQELVARHSAQAGGDGAVLGLLVCGDDVAA